MHFVNSKIYVNNISIYKLKAGGEWVYIQTHSCIWLHLPHAEYIGSYTNYFFNKMQTSYVHTLGV